MPLVIQYNSRRFSPIFLVSFNLQRYIQYRGSTMNYMSKDEISRVLIAAQPNRRDYLMIYLGYFAGLRAMEVCSLQRRDFDISTGNVYVTVQRSKGSDKTTHQLPSAVATLVREHLKGMEPNDYLFKGNRRTSVPRTL